MVGLNIPKDNYSLKGEAVSKISTNYLAIKMILSKNWIYMNELLHEVK